MGWNVIGLYKYLDTCPAICGNFCFWKIINKITNINILYKFKKEIKYMNLYLKICFNKFSWELWFINTKYIYIILFKIWRHMFTDFFFCYKKFIDLFFNCNLSWYFSCFYAYDCCFLHGFIIFIYWLFFHLLI